MLAAIFDLGSNISSMQLVLLIILMTSFYFYRKSQFTFFQKIGVKGPRPSLIWGNTKEILSVGLLELENKWVKEYGKVFGVFHGSKPSLYISDSDMIRDLTIKKFDKFTDRAEFPLGLPYPLNLVIFLLPGEQWRRMRSLLSPSFTANKLKCTTVLMDKCAKRFVRVVGSKNCKNVEFKEVCEALAMDIIGNCAFGVDCDTQTNEKDPFLVKVRGWLKEAFRVDIHLILASLFPSLRPILTYLKYKFQDGGGYAQGLIDTVKEVIAIRRQDPSMRRPDMLQLMLDAAEESPKSGEETGKINGDVDDGKSRNNTPKYRTLSDYEIIAQCFVFLFAGYESVSRSLANVIYLLSIHPDIQEKLYNEIQQHVSNDEELSYETVKKMAYLDMVVNESTRFYPATSGISRKCVETCKLGDVTIPKGLTIQVPGYYLHRDPKLWSCPDEFRPERFSPENKADLPPYGMLTFGIGQRKCIGNRFALLEIKIIIVRLLQKFKLVENDDTRKYFAFRSLTFPFPKPVDWKVFCEVQLR